MIKRNEATILTILVGVTLVVVGLAFSAPLGPTSSPVISSPRMLFAPGLFVIGVLLVFFSAVVYNVVGQSES